MKHDINYITIWENEWDPDNIDKFLTKISKFDINTVVFDIRWGHHELSEGNFDFSHMHNICEKLVEYGFKLMPLISIFYCPDWVYDKYPDIVEINESLGARGADHKGVSCAYEKSSQLALDFIDQCVGGLESYRKHITAISVSWNNEHETKFTQTHNLFRPYEKPAQEKFRSFIQKKNDSVKYWNDRWHTSYDSISDIVLPKFSVDPPKQIEQFKEMGQYLFDCYAFRRSLLVSVYRGCCERIKSHRYKTWLHFGEMFTSVDAIYQGDVVFDMITEDWLDMVVVDSNLSKLGAEENDSFVAYIIVSACMQYDKQVIFELAVEREKSIDGYLQSIKYAKAKNLNGVGFTNIIQNADFANQPEKILVALDEKESTIRLLDSRWHNRLLLIHPICGSFVLRQRQHTIGSDYVDPVQDCLMEEVKSWYDRGYDVNIIGDPKRLKSINPNAFNEILFLEPLALLSSDEKNISDFVERLPSNKPYHVKKLDSKFFEHQTGFDGKPLKFLDLKK